MQKSIHSILMVFAAIFAAAAVFAVPSANAQERTVYTESSGTFPLPFTWINAVPPGEHIPTSAADPTCPTMFTGVTDLGSEYTVTIDEEVPDGYYCYLQFHRVPDNRNPYLATIVVVAAPPPPPSGPIDLGRPVTAIIAETMVPVTRFQAEDLPMQFEFDCRRPTRDSVVIDPDTGERLSPDQIVAMDLDIYCSDRETGGEDGFSLLPNEDAETMIDPGFFRRYNPGDPSDGWAARGEVDANGLPTFPSKQRAHPGSNCDTTAPGNRCPGQPESLKAGDIIEIRQPIRGSQSFGTARFGPRLAGPFVVYEDGNGELRLASDTGETATSAEELGAGEFFLDDDYTQAASAASLRDREDPPVANNGGGSSGSGALYAGGAAVAGAALFLSGGDFSLFNYAPDFDYAITESGYAVNAGGRIVFQKDEWTLYWAGGQTNADGDFGEFRFRSGGEYKGDLLRAAFSETVVGERADYELSLSADMRGGIWNVSPTYRLYSTFDEGETDTTNLLNLEGALLYNDWIIRPAAGFQWRRADEFGDDARFTLSAVLWL